MSELKDELSSETPKGYRETIRSYEAEFNGWLSRGKEIVKRYRDDSKPINEGKKRVWSEKNFNILWSNVQTQLPALFARIPEVVCERKFKDKDPVGRFAAEIVDRTGRCFVDKPQYEAVLKACVKDLLLPGRGSLWFRYSKTDGPPLQDPNTGEIILDEVGQPVLSIADESIVVEHVGFDKFGHDCASDESKITVKWRIVEFTKDQAKARFGKKAELVTFDKQSKYESDKVEGNSNRKADIVELWDKNKGKVYWFQKSGDDEQFLDVKDDYLQLSGFFPTVPALYATTTNESLIPVADFCFYQEQAEQLDEAVNRRRLIISAIRVVGAYNAAQPELKSILKEAAENELIAVKNWVDFGATGGIKGNLDFLPLEPLIKALQVLNQEIPQLKAEIYELTGISDIIRGHTAPSETATAQQLKGQFATLRLQPRQYDVQRFARDVARTMIELAVEKFDPSTIASIINLSSFSEEEQQLFEPALELLKSDKQREYRLDIETDSMVAMDESRDREQAMQAVETFSTFMERLGQDVGNMPYFARSYGEMLKLMVRCFRGGRQLENTIEQDVDRFVEQTLNPPPQEPPPPDPAQVKAEMDNQTKQMELQLKAEQQRLDEQFRGAELQLKLREVAVREAEIALKAESEKNLHAREQNKIISEMLSGSAESTSATASKQEPSPMNLTINVPGQAAGRKRGVVSTDPVTGTKVIEMIDIPEAPTEGGLNV